ncbi:MAG: RNA polymerase sigma factor [Anaerolineales bacterium]
MVSLALAKQLHQLSRETAGIQYNMTAQEHGLDLIRRMASGDENAMGELYAAYGQRLFAYALRLTNDRAAAEDVTQEALVIAWRTAGKFRGDGRLIAWLLGIVHHTAMKSLRHQTDPLESIEETISERNASPEDQAQVEETKRWVRQGLQTLSTEHRAVLELVFYQGLTLNEVAEVCGCPLGTVKSRLNYARQHLRGVLSRNEENWR